MYKFLFVSLESLSGNLAWHVKKEGHKVRAWIKEKRDADVYDGFLDKVGDWHEHIDWADVIIFDDVGFGREADTLRKEGKKVVGGSRYTDKLEENREFGQEELCSVGVNTLPNHNFSNMGEAVDFIKKNPDRYVFKPSGNTPAYCRGFLFSGEDENGKDLAALLERGKETWGKKIKDCQLQKFINGVEVGAAKFFNGEDFVGPANIAFEHKKLFAGDVGPYTGEMGTFMFWEEESKLFDRTLAKMKDKLVKSGYRGYIDINCIVNKDGIYPLEFTCRFGYPTINIQLEAMKSKVGNLLYALANTKPFNLSVKSGFQVGAIVAVPPFPFDDEDEFDTYNESPIFFKTADIRGVHLGDVKLVNNEWRMAGRTGYALVVTGAGTTAKKAREQMYKRISNIRIQGMFYRNDIGEKWNCESDLMKTWGYI